MGVLSLLSVPLASAEASQLVRLYVRAAPIKIFGKEEKVIAIEQENGEMGLSLKMSDGFNQKWVNENQGFARGVIEGQLPDTDIKYDALIANRRTFDDPQIFRVTPCF
jgi:hypothetical protein